LTSGKAAEKMREIIEAQGGDPEVKPDAIRLGDKTHTVTADVKGSIRYVDNKRISKVARAAGAPKDACAGVYLHVKVGDCVLMGAPLYTIYSMNNAKMEDAIKISEQLKPVQIGGVILDTLT
jgi:AMP phosphorylase